MAAGPPSPASGSAEPVSSLTLAARASPCGGHYLRVARSVAGWGGSAARGGALETPQREAGLHRSAGDHPEGARRGVAPSGSGVSARGLGSPGPSRAGVGARGPARGRRDGFVNGKAPGVGLHGDAGESHALCGGGGGGGGGGTMPGAGNSPARGGRGARRSQPGGAHPGRRPEPARVGAGVATLRGAMLLYRNTQAPRTLPESSGRRLHGRS